MKKLPLLLVLLLATLGLVDAGCVRVVSAPRRAAAQERAENALSKLAAMDPRQMADFQTVRMTERLRLTPPQQATVSELNLRYAQRFHAIAAAPGSPHDRWADLKTVEADKDAELRRILTSDQQKTYEQLRVEMRDLLRDRFGVS